MPEIGYALSSEEHRPQDLVRYAARAEEAGFSFALVSDHYHPWIDRQGQSPFVWSVLGGIAQVTERLRVGTGVTCPIMRIHPAVIAQAAATAAVMMPGRFFLGVGTGESLNEHILGTYWPPHDVRLEMLEEAAEVIRKLWKGRLTSHRGRHFTVENARIYTLPDELPPIYVAAGGPKTGEAAGRFGDGLISTSPDAELVQAFQSAGGRNKPRYGQAAVCWAESEEEARKTAHEWWPTTGLGNFTWDLALPSHFEDAAYMVTEEMTAERITCGPDPQKHIEHISKFLDAGFDHVYLHQIGPDQEGFFRFYQRKVLPHFQARAARRAAWTHARLPLCRSPSPPA
jgi:G6PDH family F420-dependent oxidoreductase